jgi:hypothetical protein
MLDVGVIYGGLSFRQEIASRDFVSECRTLINNGKVRCIVDGKKVKCRLTIAR